MVNKAAAKYIPFLVIGGICTAIGVIQTLGGLVFVFLISQAMLPLAIIGTCVLIFGIIMLATGSRRKQRYGSNW